MPAADSSLVVEAFLLRLCYVFVMAGLVPAIHVFDAQK
jgi:hypothetical protein